MASSTAETSTFAATMVPWFTRLSDPDATMAELVAVIAPTMTVVGLVQRNCSFYSSAKRFGVVLRGICNEVVRQCQRRIDGSAIARSPEALAVQIRLALGLCAELKGRYEDTRLVALATTASPASSPAARPPTMARTKAGRGRKSVPSASWPTRTDQPFERFNRFMDRCNEMLDVCECMLQFGVTDAIIIGGQRSVDLMPTLGYIHAEFVTCIGCVLETRIDLFDVDTSADAFERVYVKCKVRIDPHSRHARFHRHPLTPLRSFWV